MGDNGAAEMTVIGYARVSTTDQDPFHSRAALTAAGCEVIRAEKRSGTTTPGREELRTVLDFLRKGDVLMVTRIIGSPAASATCRISSAP
jgi:DNA invertase Pin-like site-specific DNA recombinase